MFIACIYEKIILKHIFKFFKKDIKGEGIRKSNGGSIYAQSI
jgi:hypothetical protein